MTIRSGGATNDVDRQSVTAVATSSDGSFTIDFTGLSSIHGLDGVDVTAVIYSYYQDQNTYVERPDVGGFTAFPAGISGTTVTFYLMYQAYTGNTGFSGTPFSNAGAGFVPLVSQTNVANVYAKALGVQ